MALLAIVNVIVSRDHDNKRETPRGPPARRPAVSFQIGTMWDRQSWLVNSRLRVNLAWAGASPILPVIGVRLKQRRSEPTAKGIGRQPDLWSVISMMKTLFLQAPSFDGFDGGAGAKWMSRLLPGAQPASTTWWAGLDRFTGRPR